MYLWSYASCIHITHWMQYWHKSKIAIWTKYYNWTGKYNNSIQQYWHTSSSEHNLLDAITVECSCYIFEVNCSINSKWAIFGLCHYCIQQMICVCTVPSCAHFGWFYHYEFVSTCPIFLYICSLNVLFAFADDGLSVTHLGVILDMLKL